jgi:transcriptional repressor NF-X1
MSAVEIPTPSGPSRPPRRRGPRRGNRGGGSGGATHNTPPASTADAPSNPQLQLRHASIPPTAPSALAATSSNSTTSNRSGRNSRWAGNRRGSRRGGLQSQPMANGQRSFGGQLTSSLPPPPEGSLAGDAPVFVPGRPVAQRVHAPPIPRPRRMSKSQAPDMATRTHEDISNGQYECVICTNEVMSNSKIWTCKTCWSVLHMSCVKKWSNNEVSTLQQRATDNGELPPPRQWRCPGCNLPKQRLPGNYTCWCEKEIEPRSIPGLPPHSCGQSCSKSRAGKCPHPCDLICHAGPCPPCTSMGPSLACFCGKEATAKRCVDTNYDNGWSCGQVCGDVLPCGEHTCERGCHEGLCGGCEVLIESRCYCGRVEKALPCSDRDDELESQSIDETWTGSFNCGAECRRPFDCGNPDHYCESTCHVQDPAPAHCPFSPDVVTHCPCGKTPLSILSPEPRENCSAKIPHCQETCQNILICGHSCQQVCHQGECRPCFEKVEITCRCGRTTSKTICHQGVEEPPCCARVCRSTLNCGRHGCGERCCAGEKKATERQAAKRKHRAMNAPTDENFEAEHICLKACGRPLKCGNHFCADLCHKGPCRSCLEAVFEEISCSCGRTILHPPQPCGSRPPPCPFDCTRSSTCGHPQVKHHCHEESEACPKCPFLVEKPCICGKRILKNQPCWFTEVRCGLPCDKKLKCGIHFCQKACHRTGQCEDATTHCTQQCGRNKTVCEHSCSDPCHAPYPCKEITPCQAKTFITCECQNQKQAAKCLASKTSEGNSKKILDCNDECLRLQRNAKLAAALNIDPASHTDSHIPYSAQTLEMFQASTKFCQTYEREFRVFAADDKEKRLRFKPMQGPQRAFLHALAEDYGLDSESQDPEPHRHVCIFKTPRFVSAPMKTLAQCVKPKAIVEPTTSSSKAFTSTAEPYNALLLTNPRFGLTIDEVHNDLQYYFQAAELAFEISFLPSGQCVLKALPTWGQKVETLLNGLKPAVDKKVKSLSIAEETVLCAVDSSLNIVRREGESEIGGWSQVARGAGRGKEVEKVEVGVKSAFTVLGRGVIGKGKVKGKAEKKAEEAVDDWEREVEAWDQGE